MRISDWSSDVCSSDLDEQHADAGLAQRPGPVVVALAEGGGATGGRDEHVVPAEQLGQGAGVVEAVGVVDEHDDRGGADGDLEVLELIGRDDLVELHEGGKRRAGRGHAAETRAPRPAYRADTGQSGGAPAAGRTADHDV